MHYLKYLPLILAVGAAAFFIAPQNEMQSPGNSDGFQCPMQANRCSMSKSSCNAELNQKQQRCDPEGPVTTVLQLRNQPKAGGQAVFLAMLKANEPLSEVTLHYQPPENLEDSKRVLFTGSLQHGQPVYKTFHVTIPDEDRYTIRIEADFTTSSGFTGKSGQRQVIDLGEDERLVTGEQRLVTDQHGRQVREIEGELR